MKKFRWFHLILLAGLLLSACQPKANPDEEVYVSLDAPAEEGQTQRISIVAVPTRQVALETDECLKCHADKQRLIDTAKPEEPVAESESSGVG